METTQKKNIVYYIVLFLKGILLGAVSVGIPGLSASTIAILIGTYYSLINAMSNINKDFKHSILYLAFQMTGYLVGSFVAAKGFEFVYNKYPVIVVMVIIGFILGGIPKMAKECKPGVKKPSCWVVLGSIIGLLILYSFLVIKGEAVSFDDLTITGYIILFVVGLITSSTLVIPGVDFAVLLLAIGYYEPLMSTISSIGASKADTIHSLIVLGIYFAGYLIGSVLFSKLVKLLISKFFIQTQFASFAFVIAAPIIVVKKFIDDNPEFTYTVSHLIIGGVLAVAAFLSLFLIPSPSTKKHEEAIERVVNENKELDELKMSKQIEEALEKSKVNNTNEED